MKYVLAALAIAGAVAALVFRPPHADAPAPIPARIDSRLPARVAAVSRPNPIVVYVAGEVTRPGVYSLRFGDRAQAALERAGGPKPDADLVAVNLAAPLADGQELAFPKIGATIPAVGRTRGPHPIRRQGRRRAATPLGPPPHSVDLNAADAAELERLPGVGPALAQRIVDYRDANGPFASIDELADVSGISSSTQDALAGYLTIR